MSAYGINPGPRVVKCRSDIALASVFAIGEDDQHTPFDLLCRKRVRGLDDCRGERCAAIGACLLDGADNSVEIFGEGRQLRCATLPTKGEQACCIAILYPPGSKQVRQRGLCWPNLSVFPHGSRRIKHDSVAHAGRQLDLVIGIRLLLIGVKR